MGVHEQPARAGSSSLWRFALPRGMRGGARDERPGVGRRASAFWRIREELPARWTWLLGAVSITAPLLIWLLLIATGTSRLILPTPLDVLGAARELLTDGVLQADAWVSVQRVGIGFGLAVLISVPLGLAMGTFKSIEALFGPAISFVRYMPATAFVTLLVFWLGIGEEPKLALIFIGTVFFNTLMTANVVWQVPSEAIRVAFTLGAGNLTVLRKVIFPYAIPGIIDAIRVNLAAAWNLIIVAEIVAAQEGLGVRIVRAGKFLQVDQIFAVLIVIGLLGLAMDLALRVLRNRLAPWSQE